MTKLFPKIANNIHIIATAIDKIIEGIFLNIISPPAVYCCDILEYLTSISFIIILSSISLVFCCPIYFWSPTIQLASTHNMHIF